MLLFSYLQEAVMAVDFHDPVSKEHGPRIMRSTVAAVVAAVRERAPLRHPRRGARPGARDRAPGRWHRARPRDADAPGVARRAAAVGACATDDREAVFHALRHLAANAEKAVKPTMTPGESILDARWSAS